MKRILHITLLAAVLATTASGFAQNKATSPVYSGHITDIKGKAVEYATVVLLETEQQKAGTVTDSLGNFTLEANIGSYTLIAQCIGYESAQKNIVLTAGRQDTIVLKTSAFALKEVVVQAQNIERKADRFVVVVPPASGKDGTELLAEAPGVWLADDKISINGSAGTKVFVDNREIKLKGEELHSYLRSLKGDNIRQIEIIPIAGAEYDANTRGGVIRIALRRRENNGMQGNISMGSSLSSSLQQYAPAASVNARIGKWSINAAASGTFMPENRGQTSASRAYMMNDMQFDSNSESNTRSNYGTGRIGTIFEPDTANSIGAEIEYIGQASKDRSHSRTILSKAGFQIDSNGDYFQRSDYSTVAATANYFRKTDNKGSIFKMIMDYANKRSTGNNDYRVIQKTTAGNNDSLYRSQANATYDIFTTDASYLKQISKSLFFQAGLKYTHTFMDDNSCYEGFTAQQVWEPNPAYGYGLKYKENIVGAYATFSTELGKWSLMAGLRGEYTRTADLSASIERDYIDLFPNLSATYAFDRMKKWMLIGQYSRNIERPAFHYLNPNRIQMSDYSYQIGNPYLRPTYINRLSATLVYYYRYSLTIGGNLHHNLIREFCKPDAINPDVSYITPENHHTENHWFATLNVPIQLVPWCNLTANLLGVWQDIKMTKESSLARHFLGFANVNATFQLPAHYSIEVQYSGTSRLYSGNSEVAPRHTVNLYARKKLAGNRLLITAGINNIFDHQNGYLNNMEAYTTKSQYESGSTGRIFKVSLAWIFNSGKQIKKSKIERSSDSERNRLTEKQ